MNGNDPVGLILQNLAYQSPLLLVYVIGMIVSLFKLGSQARPAICGLIGFGILFITSVVIAVMQAMLIKNGAAQGAFTAISVAGTLLRALGMILLLVGLYIGRSRPRRDDDD